MPVFVKPDTDPVCPLDKRDLTNPNSMRALHLYRAWEELYSVRSKTAGGYSFKQSKPLDADSGSTFSRMKSISERSQESTICHDPTGEFFESASCLKRLRYEAERSKQ